MVFSLKKYFNFMIFQQKKNKINHEKKENCGENIKLSNKRMKDKRNK